MLRKILNHNISHLTAILFVLIFSTLVLGMSLRGHLGTPSAEELNTNYWKDDGPLELSPERGRFALLFSIAENKSFHFNLPIARFATPDLAYANGNYVSLFAPLVSFVSIPGYMIGKMFNASQIGSVAVVGLFSLCNLLLIYLITLRFTKNVYASLLAGVIFLFATPAFTYAVSLYQHHLSSFLILTSIYVLMRWKNFWSLAVIWFIFALAIPTDYPNLIFLFPVALYTAFRFVSIESTTRHFKLNFHLLSLLSLLAMALPLIFFLWFNKQSYNNPLQLSGTLRSVKAITEKGLPASAEELAKASGLAYDAKDLNRKKTATGFFKTRNMLNGFYVHTISSERGTLFYTPVILFGLIGLGVLYKRRSQYAVVMIAVIGSILALYCMWGDPWGGWAFGSRYMIPAYSLLAIGVGVFIDSIRKYKILISVFFFIIMTYSIAVNTLGAITTSKIPPFVEAQALEKLTHQYERYSYDRSYMYLLGNNSKSFFWQQYASSFMSAFNFYILITVMISILSLSLLTFAITQKGKKNEKNI